MNSILQNDNKCYVCGSSIGLECHHIFAGVANRKISQREGFFVTLCHRHHTGDGGAQYDKELNLRLKREAQAAYEKTHTREEWMKLIRKNYL